MQSQDVAAHVFNSINLLAIKRSVRLLVDLEMDVIEDFVKKYSAVVIFLLNVLDADRSAHLLSRLTDASVLYLIEEELRFLVIKEVAHCGDDLDRLQALTGYLEALDAPKTQTLSNDEVRTVIALLAEARAGRKTTSLAYLDALDPDRRGAVFGLILADNPLAMQGLLAFAADEVVAEAFDVVASHRPEHLVSVPHGLFLRRVRRDYGLLLQPGVRSTLPRSMAVVLDELDAVRATFAERIAAFDSPSRAQRIEVAHEILRSAPAEMRPVLLGDLERSGAVDSGAAFLLRAAAQSAQ